MALQDDITLDDNLYAGEDKTLNFTIYQADGTTAQNITGWSLSYRWKKSLDDADSDAVLTKTTSSGITLTVAASGQCAVAIADTDTDAVPAGPYYHELKRTDSGSETILTTGSVYLRQAVHRS